jgi:hypothetical protein
MVLLLSISFGIGQQQTETTQNIIKIEEPEIIKGIIIDDKDYTLHFDVEKTKDQKYTLLVAIELHNESYFISPNAKGDFSGKFYMDLGSYTHMAFEGDIIEVPRSLAAIYLHSSTDGTESRVYVNTIYRQPIELKSQEDFEVFGRIQFTIEPRCTFEEIPFALSFQNGVIKITSPKC